MTGPTSTFSSAHARSHTIRLPSTLLSTFKDEVLRPLLFQLPTDVDGARPKRS